MRNHLRHTRSSCDLVQNLLVMARRATGTHSDACIDAFSQRRYVCVAYTMRVLFICAQYRNMVFLVRIHHLKSGMPTQCVIAPQNMRIMQHNRSHS